MAREALLRGLRASLRICADKEIQDEKMDCNNHWLTDPIPRCSALVSGHNQVVKSLVKLSNQALAALWHSDKVRWDQQRSLTVFNSEDWYFSYESDFSFQYDSAFRIPEVKSSRPLMSMILSHLILIGRICFSKNIHSDYLAKNHSVDQQRCRSDF